MKKILALFMLIVTMLALAGCQFDTSFNKQYCANRCAEAAVVFEA